MRKIKYSCGEHDTLHDGVLHYLNENGLAIIETSTGQLFTMQICYGNLIRFIIPTMQKIEDIQACSQTDMSNWDVEDILQFGADD